MSFSVGDRLGPYEILAPLGAGGMGEVYRALDPRLGREVAIKISAEQFSERFDREARAIAALNHPHICAIYDVGPNYLVMELVEGESPQGPLPLETALNYAGQIAEALEAAHEKGIVHRDLKPANIKIKPDGTVKVLDFGLAKMTESGAPSGSFDSRDPANSPTLTLGVTQVGALLGTAAYMSPEQAKGKPVDKRADIWAFGVVLYEMLTGRKLFEGETVSDTLAGVIKEEPQFDSIPPRVRQLLKSCLRKDPRQRLRDIGDVRLLLEVEQVHEPPRAESGRRPWSWPWMVAALFALAVPAAWLLKPTADQPLLQLEISAPEGGNFGPVSNGQVQLSPDGRRLVFPASGKNGVRMLFLRLLAANSAAPLEGTANAAYPFWSPDSRWIAFFADGKLQKIDVTGGRPQVLCEASLGPNPAPGAWNSEGIILFGTPGKPIQRIASSGGTPTAVFPLDTAREETGQAGPYFLPDGRHFLFASFAKEYAIGLGSLDGKTRRYLFPQRNSPASYVPNPAGGGWMLYISGTQLVARPFDPGKAEFTGEAAVVVDPLSNGPSWSASDNGLLAFRRGRGFQSQLTWFNRDGKQVGVAGDPVNFGTSPRISPDQKTIAFAHRDEPNTDVWLFDLTRGATTRFTFEPGANSFPLWSPDGSRIFYYARRNNVGFLAERPSNGIGKETIVKSQPGTALVPTGQSRDGRWLVVSESSGPSAGARIVLLSLSDGKSVPLVEGSQPLNGSISPDGRWLLYSDMPARRREVFVQSLPTEAGPPEAGGSAAAVGKFQISTAGGSTPVWRADGKEIFYLAADGKMMAVPVESGANFFRPGSPQPLFPTRLMPRDSGRTDYDVTPDGQRFLINQPVAESVDEPISVIVNWPKLLR
ncbi:Serine/threonine protein kinase [Candidatus Sulfopaludibacter sp. SbA6]|nr:Serine/threonine protein kinase [Candidatus Sulfopaludibacter sp. SbA6]